MKAYGVDNGIRVELLPIKTVGKSPVAKYKAWLFDQRRVRVLEPFHVPRPNGGSYIIPAGFEFDGGSIPRWLLVLSVIAMQLLPPHDVISYALAAMILIGLLIERFGLMLLAFAAHDFSVRYQMLITQDGEIEDIPNVSAANSVMRRINYATNDLILIGWVAHIAVVSGAWMAWRRYRKTAPVTDWRSLDYGVELKLETTL